ncbi:MAG: hypothetical protein ACHQ5A_07010 [Opitutales bacterium]
MTPRPVTLGLILLLACAIPLGFGWFTDHAWEDYYITLRSSRNLVEGHGLVFTPGERLHTYTSPLGVLVPAGCTWLTGPGREEAALWLFRLLNTLLLAATALLVWRRFDTLRIGSLGRWLFFGLMLADAKLIDFSINGMETAMLVFFTVLLWSELERPGPPRPVFLACATAGLMWSRPDAFIIAGCLLLPHLVFRRRADGAARLPWRELIRGLGLGALLYLPWFAWAWWYYGTPVPHTIIAKSILTPPVRLADLLALPWGTLMGTTILGDLFLPAYHWYEGDWPGWLKQLAHVVSVAVVFGWLVPWLPGMVRRLSLTLFGGMFYLCVIIFFPWYAPPWTLLAALALAGAVDQAAERARTAGSRWLPPLLRTGVTLAVCLQVLILGAVSWEMRIQQRVIENGVRRDIGLWLRRNAAPGDTVFLECLGYIGYYSQLKTYDFPGLSSPEVVDALRHGARRYLHIIERVQPTWLVLRPAEIADPTRPENAFLRNYELARKWNVRPQLDAVGLLPGRAWLEHDAEFLVLRRKR